MQYNPELKYEGKMEGRFQKRITTSFLDVSFDFQLMLVVGVKVEDLFQRRDGIKDGRDDMVWWRVWE